MTEKNRVRTAGEDARAAAELPAMVEGRCLEWVGRGKGSTGQGLKKCVCVREGVGGRVSWWVSVVVLMSRG